MGDKRAKSPMRTEPITMDGTYSSKGIVKSGRKRKWQKLWDREGKGQQGGGRHIVNDIHQINSNIFMTIRVDGNAGTCPLPVSKVPESHTNKHLKEKWTV